MRYAELGEAEAWIKISGRNINNYKYADNTTLMAESEEELKSIFMKVKEKGEKAGLKLNIKKNKKNTMASCPITSWHIDVPMDIYMETMRDFIFLGYQITADGDCSHEIKRCLLLGRKAMISLYVVLKSRDIILPKNIYIVKVMCCCFFFQ